METIKRDETVATYNLGVRLPRWAMNELRDAAKADHRTQTSLVGKILLDWLKLRVLADELKQQ